MVVINLAVSTSIGDDPEADNFDVVGFGYKAVNENTGEVIIDSSEQYDGFRMNGIEANLRSVYVGLKRLANELDSFSATVVNVNCTGRPLDLVEDMSEVPEVKPMEERYVEKIHGVEEKFHTVHFTELDTDDLRTETYHNARAERNRVIHN